VNSVLWSSAERVDVLLHQGSLDTVDTDALFLPEADGYPNGYPCDADEMA
jgi:hypothetical protein